MFAIIRVDSSVPTEHLPGFETVGEGTLFEVEGDARNHACALASKFPRAYFSVVKIRRTYFNLPQMHWRDD